MARQEKGHFMYSHQQVTRLVEVVSEIGMIKQNYDCHGLMEGVVAGVLEEHFGDIEVSGWAMQQIVQAAHKYHMYTVFHMAFDQIPLLH